LKKNIWNSALIIALLFACLIVVALAIQVYSLQSELVNTKNTLLSLQQEYHSIEDNFTAIQQNYTQQQQDFMGKFIPSLETQLGAKVLVDKNENMNYLWVTGQIYNRGYGVAYNSKLEVKLFAANSSIPTISYYSLGDIDAHNYRSIMKGFYSSFYIDHWEIDAKCSQTK
jgi:hypothetical protein